jgi:hypothetical protein
VLLVHIARCSGVMCHTCKPSCNVVPNGDVFRVVYLCVCCESVRCPSVRPSACMSAFLPACLKFMIVYIEVYEV